MNIILYIAIVLTFAFFLVILNLDISDIRTRSIRHLPEDPLSASERRKARRQREKDKRNQEKSFQSKSVKKKPANKKKAVKGTTNTSKHKLDTVKPSAKVSSYEAAKLKYRKKR